LFAFVRACALALGWGGNDWNDLLRFGLSSLLKLVAAVSNLDGGFSKKKNRWCGGKAFGFG